MSEILKFQQKKINVTEEASKRFRERSRERENVLDQLKNKNKNPFDIDLRERVVARENLINPSDGLAYERIVGKSDLLGINYLELGLRTAKAVCRIQVRSDSGRVLGFGSGFMISPSLLMTNNHVLDSVEHSRRSLAEFNFEDDINFMPKPSKTFAIDPDRFFYTNDGLDFTIVAVKPVASDGTKLSDFGYLPLKGETGKALLGEYVTIIQHPSGASKQITVRENRVIDMPGEFLHYLTDTLAGSSGSPVINDQWYVVALHHAGVPKKDADGKVLTADNKVWTPDMDEDRIAWIANEGIRISSIVNYMKGIMNNLSSGERALLNDMFSGVPETPTETAITPIETEVKNLEWYDDSEGYLPDFLGVSVPLPNISESLMADVVPLLDGSGNELRYTHFSLKMRKSRGLAFFTAVNIDGDQIKDIKRSKDSWYFDPRIDETYQFGPALYEKNDLDRGHLVRRLDPVWGEDAADANEDTFHFTNCSPQHKDLNQKTWLNLENYILNNAKKHGIRVSVFTGPVFRDDDMIYRGEYQIPAEFWKVVVMMKDDDTLSATAYLQTQKNLIADLGYEFAYGKYKTYQVKVSKIESLTELDFGLLRNSDPLATIEGVMARIIEGPGDIRI